MGYSYEEWETDLIWDHTEKKWRCYSTVPKDIKKIKEYGEITNEEVEDGKVISVSGWLDKGCVSIRKPRVLSEEQKQKLAARLQEARNQI